MLYRINLLPWRENQREEHRRRFVGLVVLGVMVALGIQWGVGKYYEYQQDLQQERLDYLTTYISDLDKRIEAMKIAELEHSKILERLKVVEALQNGRNKTTDFMNLMPAVIPEGVYVDKIKMNDLEIEISGISDSTPRLATMLDNMERSAKLLDVEMHSIVHGKARFGKEFQTFKVSFMFNTVEEQKGENNMVNWQDLEMDEIAEWPLLPQLVVICLLVLLIQGFGYWFYLKPEEARLNNLIQEEQTLKVALRIKANKVAALPQLQSQLDELTTRYELLLQQLPAQKELATMLASVNELGIDNKLTFTRIDWGEKQSENFLYRLPLNIELTGDFHDIGRFSQAIATLPRIITFKDVTWQRVSQESETLHFRVRANTYQFKPEEKKDEK